MENSNNHKENKKNGSGSLLNNALNAKYVFVSVAGSHAQEPEEEIYIRKTNDIKTSGESFWVSKIDVKFVGECRRKFNGKVGYLILVESSGHGKSAEDTKTTDQATQYSEDKIIWEDITKNISQVTGKLGKGATAYYFDDIELYDKSKPIDLDKYAEGNDYLRAVKFRQGHSNVFAKKSGTKMPYGMKSYERKIVAVLKLKYPYVVWVR